MISKKTVWFYTWILVAICLLVTAFVYLYTGQVLIMLVFAPPLVHWILKKRLEDKDTY